MIFLQKESYFYEYVNIELTKCAYFCVFVKIRTFFRA